MSGRDATHLVSTRHITDIILDLVLPAKDRDAPCFEHRSTRGGAMPCFTSQLVFRRSGQLGEALPLEGAVSSLQSSSGSYAKLQRHDSKFDFEYTGGNITEYNSTLYLNSGDSLFTKTTFAFDDQENFLTYLAFNSLDLIIDLSLWQAPYWLSSNNVTTETGYNVIGQEDRWSNEKIYTYNWENGMITDFTYTFQTNVGSDLFVRPVRVYYGCW